VAAGPGGGEAIAAGAVLGVAVAAPDVAVLGEGVAVLPPQPDIRMVALTAAKPSARSSPLATAFTSRYSHSAEREYQRPRQCGSQKECCDDNLQLLPGRSRCGDRPVPSLPLRRSQISFAAESQSGGKTGPFPTHAANSR
jgi:hypothetical protein